MNRFEIVVWDPSAEKVVTLRRELKTLTEDSRGPYSVRIEMGTLDEVWFGVDAEIRSSKVPESAFPPVAGGCDAVVVPVDWTGSCRRFKEIAESTWKITNKSSLQELESSIAKSIDGAFEGFADSNGLGRKFMWTGSAFAARVSVRPDILLLFVVTHDHDASMGNSSEEAARRGVRGALQLIKQLPVRVARLFVPPLGADPWSRLPVAEFAAQFRTALEEERASFAANYGSTMTSRWVRAPKPVRAEK
jgi:hypothetical protein